MPKQSGHTQPRVIIGIILIAFALLVFLNNIGIRLLGYALSNWPLILIAVGGVLLASDRNKKRKPQNFVPFALIGVGVVFFLAQRGVFNLSFHAVAVPLVLVLVGLHLIKPARHSEQKFGLRLDWLSSTDKDTTTIDHEDNDKLDIFAALGGGNYINRSQNLKGGNIICVLGGAEVDLRDANFEGDRIKIESLAFMGGAELKIPPNWQVTVTVLPLLGGVSDQTVCLAEKMGVPKKDVIISGVSFMGGLTIRN